jgi:hypothetical protein
MRRIPAAAGASRIARGKLGWFRVLDIPEISAIFIGLRDK